MPTLPATTHAARFQPYFWALQGAGVDVGRMLSKARIPSIALYEKDIIVSSVKFGSFVCETARNEGIEDIAAMGVEKDGFANLEPWVQSHFSAATTLNELVKRYCELTQVYIPHRAYTIKRYNRVSEVRLGAKTDRSLGDMLNFFEWGNVWLLLKVLRHALGQNFKPELIGFQSATPFSPMQKRKLSGIRVSRERETTSLVIRNDLLAAPLPDFFQRNTKGVEFPDLPAKLSFVDGMREVLKPCLSEDWLSVHTAAEMAGCSTRTLQRRLLDSGLTYSQLLDQLRVDIAQKLLAQGSVRAIDIGLEVGFEDQAHFSRSFRRVTGITPSQYRCSMIDHTSEVAYAGTKGTAQFAQPRTGSAILFSDIRYGHSRCKQGGYFGHKPDLNRNGH